MVIKAKTQMLTDLPLNLSFFFPDNLKLPERYKYTHTHYSFLDQEQITDTVITLWLDWYEAYVNLENAFLSYFILFALNVFFFFVLSNATELNVLLFFSFSFFFCTAQGFQGLNEVCTLEISLHSPLLTATSFFFLSTSFPVVFMMNK